MPRVDGFGSKEPQAWVEKGPKRGPTCVTKPSGLAVVIRDSGWPALGNGVAFSTCATWDAWVWRSHRRAFVPESAGVEEGFGSVVATVPLAAGPGEEPVAGGDMSSCSSGAATRMPSRRCTPRGGAPPTPEGFAELGPLWDF